MLIWLNVFFGGVAGDKRRIILSRGLTEVILKARHYNVVLRLENESSLRAETDYPPGLKRLIARRGGSPARHQKPNGCRKLILELGSFYLAV